jgi:leucyl-tRNA---protein transferase
MCPVLRLLAMERSPVIFESFRASEVSPDGMDELWSRGWRHFGEEFFRYSLMEHQGRWEIILPLRIELGRFAPTKSQRRVLRKNQDLKVSTAPASDSLEADAMFQRHKTRFQDNVPDALASFLGAEPADGPCQCLELRCHRGDDLLAMSFFDLGARSISSVYGMFEPVHSARGLGIFTLLQEILWAQESGRSFVYPGYATLGPSHYDYKKQFHGLEAYDWMTGRWRPWPRS